MSSQASSAGHGEKEVRRKIVKTGDVDVMISIRSNFFYTRTVPCELWFFDRAKGSLPSPPSRERARVRGPETVLMLDARTIYRKVTRKIYDFSPEQMQNLAAIVWLYRGQRERFLGLVKDYLGRVCEESAAIPGALTTFETTLADLRGRFDALTKAAAKHAELDLTTSGNSNIASSSSFRARCAAPQTRNPGSAKNIALDSRFLGNDPIKEREITPDRTNNQALADAMAELREAATLYEADARKLLASLHTFGQKYTKALSDKNDSQQTARKAFDPIAEAIRGLVKQVDLLYKLAARVADLGAEISLAPGNGGEGWGEGVAYDRRATGRLVKQLDEERKAAVEQLKHARLLPPPGGVAAGPFSEGRA